jgi:thiol-disulfide isomerase/thioredoxin
MGAPLAGELPIAPEFTHHDTTDWINSPPLTLASSRGAPVLVEFWTFDCINCLRSMDWMKSIATRKTHAGLKIVSVHTPEFDHEKRIENVRAAIGKLEIAYPVMLDVDFSYWRALNNQFWPAFYLIDSQGRIVAKHFGELHVGKRSAEQFEKEIDRALANVPAR